MQSIDSRLINPPTTNQPYINNRTGSDGEGGDEEASVVLLEQEPADDKPVARGCHTFGRIKPLKTQLLLADPPQGYFKVYAFPPGKGKNLSRFFHPAAAAAGGGM
jgi:hypothetical protein